MEAIVERRLASFRKALWFLLGVTLALAVVLVAGDLAFGPADFALGWATLWLLSILAALPLGIVMLIGPVWRLLPLARRRATAIGYLAVPGFDLAMIALALSTTYGPSGPGLWLLIFLYGLGLALAIMATQPAKRREGEELFP